jgi:hypothetical protein
VPKPHAAVFSLSETFALSVTTLLETIPTTDSILDPRADSDRLALNTCTELVASEARADSETDEPRVLATTTASVVLPVSDVLELNVLAATATTSLPLAVSDKLDTNTCLPETASEARAVSDTVGLNILADTDVVSLAVADSDIERGIEVPAAMASDGRTVSDTLDRNVLVTTVVVSAALADSETEAFKTTPPEGNAEKGAVENGAKPNI